MRNPVIARPVYVAHLRDHVDRTVRYVEYDDVIIDVISLPVPGPFWAWADEPLAMCRRFVRTDPPQHDDLGLPIFREAE